VSCLAGETRNRSRGANSGNNRPLWNSRDRRGLGDQHQNAPGQSSAVREEADLAWNQTRVRQALAEDNRKYWSSSYSLQQDAWDHQRENLAADDSLASKEWDDVRRAFRWTASLELLAAQRRDTTGEKRPMLGEHGVDQLEKASRAVTVAIKILKRHAQGVALEEPSDEDPN
jgi:hypothetical protein